MYQKLLHVLFPVLCLLALFLLVAHFTLLYLGHYLYSLLMFGLLLLTNGLILLVNQALMGGAITKPADSPQAES